mgnify:CR=1 FL=1|jgi:hypothetical protein
MSQQQKFIPVPETHLPHGRIVPAFEVSQFLISRSPSGELLSAPGFPPLVRTSFPRAIDHCRAMGWSLIRESQWLAIAWNVSRMASNWTRRTPGNGKLRQGIRKGDLAEPASAMWQPHKGEERWKTLNNGHEICDFGGNAWSWVFDDVQGRLNGEANVIEESSISLTTAPFASWTHGMGIRPRTRQVWDERSLIRGGGFSSDRDAGAFALSAALTWGEYLSVGFRATRAFLPDEQ